MDTVKALADKVTGGDAQVPANVCYYPNPTIRNQADIIHRL